MHIYKQSRIQHTMAATVCTETGYLQWKITDILYFSNSEANICAYKWLHTLSNYLSLCLPMLSTLPIKYRFSKLCPLFTCPKNLRCLSRSTSIDCLCPTATQKLIILDVNSPQYHYCSSQKPDLNSYGSFNHSILHRYVTSPAVKRL